MWRQTECLQQSKRWPWRSGLTQITSGLFQKVRKHQDDKPSNHDSYPEMALAALAKGASSPAQMCSRRSQKAIHQRLPWGFRFTQAVHTKGAMTMIANIYRVLPTHEAQQCRWSKVQATHTEAQLKSKLIPEPMVFTARLLTHETRLLFNQLHQTLPISPLGSAARGLTKSLAINQYLFKGRACPASRFPCFLNYKSHFCSGMPGKFILRDSGSDVTLPWPIQARVTAVFP